MLILCDLSHKKAKHGRSMPSMAVIFGVFFCRHAGKRSMDKADRTELSADPGAVILHLRFVHEYDTGNKADAERDPS